MEPRNSFAKCYDVIFKDSFLLNHCMHIKWKFKIKNHRLSIVVSFCDILFSTFPSDFFLYTNWNSCQGKGQLVKFLELVDLNPMVSKHLNEKSPFPWGTFLSWQLKCGIISFITKITSLTKGPFISAVNISVLSP